MTVKVNVRIPKGTRINFPPGLFLTDLVHPLKEFRVGFLNFQELDPKSFHNYPKAVFLQNFKLIAQRMPEISQK